MIYIKKWSFWVQLLLLSLTHWGRVTHMCVGNLAIIGTNAGILLIGPCETNFSEILISIQMCSFKKMHFKMLSAKWRPFSLGFNVLSVRHKIIRIRLFPTNVVVVIFRLIYLSQATAISSYETHKCEVNCYANTLLSHKAMMCIFDTKMLKQFFVWFYWHLIPFSLFETTTWVDRIQQYHDDISSKLMTICM